MAFKVDNRCAIINTVLSCRRLFKALCIACSVAESKADVASSSNKMGAFFQMARAMAMRCRCPPDNLTPCSPIKVSY